MLPTDIDPFCADLAGLMEVLSHGRTSLTERQAEAWFRVLAPYPLEVVRAAMNAFMREPGTGRTLPVPSDIVAKIEGTAVEDGRPGAEEAWAICFRARDEMASVVWTAEMEKAFGIARPILLAGDEVGSRMAFKEAYSRLVATARSQRVRPMWIPSFGHDAGQRDAALSEAVNAGRLSSEWAPAGPALGLDQVLALPAPVDATPSNLAARERARVSLAATKARLMGVAQGPSEAELERERTTRLKNEADAKVRSYLSGQSCPGEVGREA